MNKKFYLIAYLISFIITFFLVTTLFLEIGNLTNLGTIILLILAIAVFLAITIICYRKFLNSNK